MRRTALWISFAILAAGCAGDVASTTSQIPATTMAPAPSTTTTQVEAGPDAGGRIAWFVSLLNGENISAEDYQQRFGDEFRAQVPFDTAFGAVLDQFRPLGPFKIVESGGTAISGAATVEAPDGTQFRITAEVDTRDVITTLLIQPTEQPELENPPSTVDEAFTRLAELGELHAMTAEVVDGGCRQISAYSADVAAPLGSVFKLYVLAALGEAFAAGDIGWGDELIIRDELKSIATGTLQDRPAGDVVSVREAAELMISISDNTAADHLIDLLGRETIESTQARYGITTPALNTPFLTTRELAALKVGPASGLRDPQWINGDETTRRSLLIQLADITPGDLPVAEWVDPIDPDVVEWFATPSDLCVLAARLGELARTVPEIAEILEINPGVPATVGTWDRIWFKGGSEPGLAAAWWVTEAAGRVFVTAGSVVNPETAFDSTEAILLLAAARDLVAR